MGLKRDVNPSDLASFQREWRRVVDRLDGQPKYKPTVSKTAAYTADYQELVICDPSGGGFTVTLPYANGHVGEQVVVKNNTTSTNTITIAASGTETVDGAATTSIASSRSSLTFAATLESAWVII